MYMNSSYARSVPGKKLHVFESCLFSPIQDLADNGMQMAPMSLPQIACSLPLVPSARSGLPVKRNHHSLRLLIGFSAAALMERKLTVIKEINNKPTPTTIKMEALKGMR